MKVLLFASVGLGLLFANAWYLRSLCRAFLNTAMPDVIAPFEYVGAGEKDATKGQAMAKMLGARLMSLQRELVEAEDALRDVDPLPPPTTSGNTIAPPPDGASLIQLTARVIDAPTFSLTVSGVDVSGLFSWVYRGLAEGRAIRVIVHSPASGANYTVAAHLETPGLNDFWLVDVAAADMAVVEEIAVEILRQHAVKARRFQEAAVLDRKEFGSLIVALRKSAALNRLLQRGAEPQKSEYNEIVKNLEPVVARASRWRTLVELIAKAAENGGELPKALQFSNQELRLFDAEKKGSTLLELDKKEREAIAERIAKLTQATLPPVVDVTPDSSGVATEYPLNALAVPRASLSQRSPRVAILGGVPLLAQRQALGGTITPTRSDSLESEQPNEFSEHIGMVAVLVRKVAPTAELIFAPMRSRNGELASGEMLASFHKLADEKPDVLLIPMSLPEDRFESTIVNRLAPIVGSTVVVIAAGNRGPGWPAQLEQTMLADKILIADAVDPSGMPAAFSSRSDKVVWAPGDGVPVDVVGPSGSLTRQVRSGTSFSAALVAGLAARLKSETPELSAAEIIQRLRESAKQLSSGGPSVVQFEPALLARNNP
jgi:hypothetical protein